MKSQPIKALHELEELILENVPSDLKTIVACHPPNYFLPHCKVSVEWLKSRGWRVINSPNQGQIQGFIFLTRTTGVLPNNVLRTRN